MDSAGFAVVLTALTAAFGWLTTQIAGLKTEVKEANKKHEECEEARRIDGLKIVRLEMAAEMLGRATGTTKQINEALNPNNPTVPASTQHLTDSKEKEISRAADASTKKQ